MTRWRLVVPAVLLATAAGSSGCALLVDGHWSFPLSSALAEMDHERTREWEEQTALYRFDVLVAGGEAIPLFFAEVGIGHWAPVGFPVRSGSGGVYGVPIGTQTDNKPGGGKSTTYLFWMPVRLTALVIDVLLLPVTGLHDLLTGGTLRSDPPRLPQQVEAGR